MTLPCSVIDLGTGTGDLALMLERIRSAGPQRHRRRLLDLDVAVPPVVGPGSSGASFHLTAADAVNLPFDRDSVDAIVTAFTLRNVP